MYISILYSLYYSRVQIEKTSANDKPGRFPAGLLTRWVSSHRPQHAEPWGHGADLGSQRCHLSELGSFGLPSGELT